MVGIVILIQEVVDSYRTDSGKQPAAILLGPKEYRELCYYVNEKSQSAAPTGLVTEFMGYPIYLKELPGVELILDYREAFHAAYR